MYLALLDRVNTAKNQPQMFASSQALYDELLNIYQAADPVLYSDALSDYKQVEKLACAHNRSFNNTTAVDWMVKEVGLHPNQLFTSEIQALCQLLRYEDAVEILCIVKNIDELRQYLLKNTKPNL